MIFDASRYPASINVLWMPIGIWMLFHAVRGVVRGKFKNRGNRWSTRADSPLLFWAEVALSSAFGIVGMVVGAIYLWTLLLD